MMVLLLPLLLNYANYVLNLYRVHLQSKNIQYNTFIL